MNDELVKMLRVCGDSNNSCGNCPVRENDGSCPHGDWEFAAEKYMLQAADAIEELQADNAALNGTVTNLLEQIKDLGKPRWIPVTERLPEDGQWVLVWGAGQHIPIMMFRESGAWIDDQFEFHSNVSYWQPLPEPPQEG